MRKRDGSFSFLPDKHLIKKIPVIDFRYWIRKIVPPRMTGSK
ncbi:MAG: hypothetical protein R3B60_00605 [Candidatus Paceibacterota bacterium]